MPESIEDILSNSIQNIERKIKSSKIEIKRKRRKFDIILPFILQIGENVEKKIGVFAQLEKKRIYKTSKK